MTDARGIHRGRTADTFQASTRPGAAASPSAWTCGAREPGVQIDVSFDAGPVAAVILGRRAEPSGFTWRSRWAWGTGLQESSQPTEDMGRVNTNTIRISADHGRLGA